MIEIRVENLRLAAPTDTSVVKAWVDVQLYSDIDTLTLFDVKVLQNQKKSKLLLALPTIRREKKFATTCKISPALYQRIEQSVLLLYRHHTCS